MCFGEQAQKEAPWVLACPVVATELHRLGLDRRATVQTFDIGCEHPDSERVRTALQKAVNRAGMKAPAVVLAHGRCGGAVVGLEAHGAPLVVPRADDCIALFLGGPAVYRRILRAEPGTYFLTRGWLDLGLDPFAGRDRLVSRWGRPKADRILAATLRRYTRLALITFGAGDDIEFYRAKTLGHARAAGLTYGELHGSTALLESLVDGPWDDRFLVVAPGGTIRFEDLLLRGDCAPPGAESSPQTLDGDPWTTP